MLALLLIPIFSLLDAIRGNAVYWWESKAAVTAWMSIIYTSLCYYYQVTDEWYFYLAILVATWLSLLAAFVPGWGAFFTSYSGWLPATKEKDWGYWFANLIQPDPETPADARRWGTAGMLFRHILFALPFIVQGYFVHPVGYVLAVLSPALSLPYPAIRYLDKVEWNKKLFLHYNWTPVRLAELGRGALLGLYFFTCILFSVVI